MRKKECSYSEWPGQTDGRRVSLSVVMVQVWQPVMQRATLSTLVNMRMT